MTASLLLPLAAMIPPPPAPPAASGQTPVIVMPAGSRNQERAMLAWVPGEARCAGSIVTPEFLERPMPTLAWGSPINGSSVSYAFDIAPDGRTLGIRQLDTNVPARGSDDIAPSLAATHFAAGSGHADCTITYVSRQESLRVASVPDLIAYTMTPASGPLPKQGWQRIFGEGTCGRGPNEGLLNRAFPNFKALASTPGVKEWSMVGYDISAEGKTANIQVIAGTGNAALDSASTKAVAETRYYGEARTGCRFPYWKSPANLPAPEAPEEQAFRPAGATCPDKRDWAVQPALRFPEAYRRRSIEGWAVVTFDVALWGEFANVKVAASQPTEDFGKQAVLVVRGAKVATTKGFVGCVDRVRFRMAPGDEGTD